MQRVGDAVTGPEVRRLDGRDAIQVPKGTVYRHGVTISLWVRGFDLQVGPAAGKCGRRAEPSAQRQTAGSDDTLDCDSEAAACLYEDSAPQRVSERGGGRSRAIASGSVGTGQASLAIGDAEERHDRAGIVGSRLRGEGWGRRPG